jgi:segregation and condensation protein B
VDDRPLRLIAASPVDQLARTIEALLVVASQPLSSEELAAAAHDDPDRVALALSLVGERYREGRSGIVLEHVAGGYAFRAAREAADACARLFERPAERGLSQAALETLSVVAYLGPVSRPEIARIRGVAADSAVASLVERGLIAEAGRENAPGGAVRYRVTPLFERVFGLESLAAMPRLDDLGSEPDVIRDRPLFVRVFGLESLPPSPGPPLGGCAPAATRAGVPGGAGARGPARGPGSPGPPGGRRTTPPPPAYAGHGSGGPTPARRRRGAPERARRPR